MGMVIPAVMLGSALLSGLFKHKAQSKQAEQERLRLAEERAAQERKYVAEKAYWGSNETMRGTRDDLAQSILGRMQPSLQKGAPNYQIDPGILARLKAPRPFPGSLPANPAVGDPGAGMGSSLLSGLFGGVSSISLNALLAKLANSGGVAGGVPAGVSEYGSQQMHGVEYCKSFPTAPGCMPGTGDVNAGHGVAL